MVKREHTIIDLTTDEDGGDPVAQRVNVEEPAHLMCPITITMMRDPVMLVESGHTYERAAIERHLRSSQIDPRSHVTVGSTQLSTNWGIRNAVEEWLEANQGVTPDGWDTRDMIPPSGTREEKETSAMTFVLKVKSTCTRSVYDRFMEVLKSVKNYPIPITPNAASELEGVVGVVFAQYPALYDEFRETYLRHHLERG